MGSVAVMCPDSFVDSGAVHITYILTLLSYLLIYLTPPLKLQPYGGIEMCVLLLLFLTRLLP